MKVEDLSLIKARGSLIKGLRPVKSLPASVERLQHVPLQCILVLWALEEVCYPKRTCCMRRRPLVLMMDNCNTAWSISEYDLQTNNTEMIRMTMNLIPFLSCLTDVKLKVFATSFIIPHRINWISETPLWSRWNSV